MSLSKKIKRLIVKLVIILVLVLVIVIAGAILFIDHIAKAGVEKGVPAVLGKDITASVDRFHIKPYNGRVEINNLIIGNPEGFSKEYAFNLGEVVADVDLGTVTKDKIRIEELTLKNIDVVLEQPLKGKSNLEEILDRLKKGEQEEKEKEKEPKDQKESKENTFQIDSLVIENVGVTVKIQGLQEFSAHFSIKPKQNLGADGEGLTATDLAYEILGAIIENTFKLDSVNDALGKIGKAAADIGNAAVDAVTNVFTGASDAAADTSKNISDAATETGKNISQGVSDAGKNISDAATETGKNISQGVSDAGKSISDAATETGKNISQGVGNALGGLLGGGKKAEAETPAQPQGN